jgi:hypothetical protein
MDESGEQYEGVFFYFNLVQLPIDVQKHRGNHCFFLQLRFAIERRDRLGTAGKLIELRKTG